ncbi:MAG: peroxiredoxin [bacterium]|nr:peroxiredoxin [bacterium]
MSETPRNLVVVMTHGPESELASVAFTIANGGLTAGLKVSIFLTSNAVDTVRKRATDHAHVKPLDPLAELIEDFKSRGGFLWACTPCVKSRGYEQADLIDGVTVAGASGMHELIQSGAATLSF